MLPFTYVNPTTILFGPGKVDDLGKESAKLGNKVLLVTGGQSGHTSGYAEQAAALLGDAGLTVSKLSGVTPNPDVAFVRQGAKVAREEQVGLVVAVGGGSVIDCAKAVAAAALYDGDPWDFFAKTKVIDQALPLGAVLTLAATGTEMNGNSVVSNQETGEKRALYSPHLFPRFSILDPALTVTTPSRHTANGAVDILSHIFEQYFHHDSPSPIQDGIAETLMATVIVEAPAVLRDPADLAARTNLMWASTLALNGLIGAGVTGDWATHIIGHELTARYKLAHGEALAVVFPSWMRHVMTTDLSRFARFGQKVWGVGSDLPDDEAARAAIVEVENYFADTLGVATLLSGYGITEADCDDQAIAEMANSAMKFRKLGAFLPLKKEDIEAILQACR